MQIFRCPVNIVLLTNNRYIDIIHCAEKMLEMENRDYRISEKETIEGLLEALQELPQVRSLLESNSSTVDREIDAKIDFEVDGKKFVMLIEAKKAVYPRDVREIIWQMSHWSTIEENKNKWNDIVLLLAAESISPGAKELLQKEKVGYYDSGGSLFIPAKGAYFFIEKPPPKRYEKSVRSLFRGKRSQVLHALLLRHDEWFGVNELAKVAEVSAATASETLTAMERFEWLGTRGQGPSKKRRLMEPSALLNEWRKQILNFSRGPNYRRYYVPGLKPETIIDRLAELCELRNIEYALTQESAAQRYAPYLSSISSVTCRLAPSRAADAIVSELEARVVNEGANLKVIETRSHSEFLFKERVGLVWLASPVQVYLDLLRDKGRAQEMAEHIRQERIGF